LGKSVWIEKNCRHKDLVGVRERFRREELGKCLREKTIVVVGDSILRGPTKRMLSPYLATDVLKYWPAHSFGSVLGTEGIML